MGESGRALGRNALVLATVLAVTCGGGCSEAEPVSTPVERSRSGQDQSLPLAVEDGGVSGVQTRKISFETTEGTWMSLDVSPDAKSIVFDLLGDLYSLSIDGGRATRLTSGIAFDSQPRFSPDGHHLVFVSDRSGDENVWTLDLSDGAARQVTDDQYAFFNSPDWSPTGEEIVVSRDPKDRVPGASGRYAPQLWVYSLNGEEPRGLTPYPAAPRWFGAAYTPDGKALLATAALERSDVDAVMPMTSLYSIELDTEEATIVTDASGGGMRPTLSPDARWLVYGAREAQESILRLRDLHSGDDQVLLRGIDRDHQETVPGLDFLPGSAFTPDSKSLVMAFGGGFKRISIPEGDVSDIPFRADVELTLGPEIAFSQSIEDGPVSATQVREPALSPDGTQVAFSAFNSIWVMKLPNGEPRRLSPDYHLAQQPAWSTDGRTVFYVTWDDANGGHIFAVEATGSTPRQITSQAAFYAQPVVVDETTLAVWQGSASERMAQLRMQRAQPAVGLDLNLVGLDRPRTRTLHKLTSRCHNRDYGSCIPMISVHDSATKLAFLNNRGEMLSVALADGKKRKLFSAEGLAYIFFRRAESAPADQAALSADGRRALVRTGAHLYMVDLSDKREEPPHFVLTKSRGPGFRKVNAVGGEFADFSGNGRHAAFALGPSLFFIDVERFGRDPSAVIEYRPEVAVPRQVPQERLLLRNARVITMNGDEVMEQADLLIDGPRIVRIAPSGTIPEAAETLDLSGKTVMPGLVDVHMHVRLPGDLLSSQSWELAANLAYGVTTGLDPSPGTSHLAYADLIESGDIVGPRLFGTGPIIGFDEGVRLQTMGDARDLVRRFDDYYGAPLIKQYLTGNRRDQQLVAIAAHEQEIGATTEGGATGYKYWLSQLLDGYPRHEHNFHYPLYNDVKTLIVEADFSHSSQMLTLRSEGGPSVLYSFLENEVLLDTSKARRFLPDEWRVANVHRRRWSFSSSELVHENWARDMADIISRGGNVALGNHGNVPGLGTHWEMQAIATGMSSHDVLRVATIMGAKHIGMERDIGSIEPGKLADLLVLSADPLDDVRNAEEIRYVIKGGVVYDGDTLDRVWPPSS